MTTAKEIEAKLDCPAMPNREKTEVQKKSFKVKDLISDHAKRIEDQSVEANKKNYQ